MIIEHFINKMKQETKNPFFRENVALLLLLPPIVIITSYGVFCLRINLFNFHFNSCLVCKRMETTRISKEIALFVLSQNYV